jgi:tRNA pseudouridine13 synthase
MKLRRLPEDFDVEELTNVSADGGQFALYRLTKQSLGTPEAVAAVLERWKLPRASLSYGGLKDRHAVTRQHVTILRGPRRGLEQQHLKLDYLGQTAAPFTPRDIIGNRFAIVLRDLTEGELTEAQAALRGIETDGVPNYFDDQRFGSRGESGEFVARPWCLGDYERALWLALADPTPHDRPADREEKRILREHWGRWDECRGLLAKSGDRSVAAIVAFLAGRPRDFRGALTRISVDLRGLYLAAFQSALWNRMLATLLRETCREDQLAEIGVGEEPLPFPRQLDEAQREALHQARLPLPTARSRHEAGPYAALMQRVVAAEGLELRQLRVKYPRDSFFSKGQRAAMVVPSALTASAEADELYRGRQKLRLRFDLPRGSYATIVLKQVGWAMPTKSATN